VHRLIPYPGKVLAKTPDLGVEEVLGTVFNPIVTVLKEEFDGVPVTKLRILLCTRGIWQFIDKKLTASPGQGIEDGFRSAVRPLKDGLIEALKYENIFAFPPVDNAYCRTILSCDNIFQAITVYLDAYQAANRPCEIDDLFCWVAGALRTGLPKLFRPALASLLANHYLWTLIRETISSVSFEQNLGILGDAVRGKVSLAVRHVRELSPK
jgi:hypothetical protein